MALHLRRGVGRMSFDLGNYVEVKDRVRTFLDAHQEGSIVCDPPSVVEIGGQTFVASTARVYRSPEDPCPVQASAWEVFPGKTPYTKDSEAMNAETSAVGRALGFLGFGIDGSLAAREDVQRRQGDADADRLAVESQEQRKRLHEACGGDAELAKALWGDRSKTEPIPEDELADLMDEGKQKS